MIKEFNNYVIESDLYYFLLAYNEANDFFPTGGKKYQCLQKTK